MWPASFWEKLYEPLIRRAAGLGRPAACPIPITTRKRLRFCDLLVIGAGPAGLMAALDRRPRRGARHPGDEDFLLGGRLLSERCEIDGMAGAAWAARRGPNSPRWQMCDCCADRGVWRL